MCKYKIILFISLLFLSACSQSVEREVERVSSPDARVDVVVVEVETDATVSTPTKIYIVPKGFGTNKEEPILVADHFELKKVSWIQKNLILEFSGGRIFNYKNFWLSKKVDNFEYNIKIFLKDSNYPE